MFCPQYVVAVVVADSVAVWTIGVLFFCVCGCFLASTIASGAETRSFDHVLGLFCWVFLWVWALKPCVLSLLNVWFWSLATFVFWRSWVLTLDQHLRTAPDHSQLRSCCVGRTYAPFARRVTWNSFSEARGSNNIPGPSCQGVLARGSLRCWGWGFQPGDPEFLCWCCFFVSSFFCFVFHVPTGQIEKQDVVAWWSPLLGWQV